MMTSERVCFSLELDRGGHGHIYTSVRSICPMGHSPLILAK